MEYVERVLEAVRYIESRLDQKISIDEIVNVAGYSKFHFQRLFHQVTNRTLGQYIMGRKLTEAAKVIRKKKYRIIDVSYMFGFESHETFTRAFKTWFDVLPNDWKVRGNIPKHLLVEEIKEDYLAHIQHCVTDAIESVVLEQKTVRGYLAKSGEIVDIFEAWRKLQESCKDVKRDKYGVIQYLDSVELDMMYRYLACCESQLVEERGDQQEFILPKTTYLVFDHKGSVDRLPLTYRYIYGTWIAKNKIELSSPFDFEYYGEQFYGESHPESIIRIYVPVLVSSASASPMYRMRAQL